MPDFPCTVNLSPGFNYLLKTRSVDDLVGDKIIYCGVDGVITKAWLENEQIHVVVDREKPLERVFFYDEINDCVSSISRYHEEELSIGPLAEAWPNIIYFYARLEEV